MLTSSYTNLYPSLFTHYLLISFSASLTLFTLAHLCLFLFSTFACLPNSFAFSAIPLLVYFSSSHNNIHSLILPTHIFFLLSALPTFSSLPTFLPFIVFPCVPLSLVLQLSKRSGRGTRIEMVTWSRPVQSTRRCQ